jgi:hypothetical protein
MSQPAAKVSALERNNQEWESLKREIYRIYIKQNNTLKITMSEIEERFRFKRRFVILPYHLMLLNEIWQCEKVENEAKGVGLHEEPKAVSQYLKLMQYLVLI